MSKSSPSGQHCQQYSLPEPDGKLSLDQLLTNHIGQFGTYQKIQFFLFCLPVLLVSLEVFAWSFIGVVQPHRCLLRNESLNDSPYDFGLKNNLSGNGLSCHRPANVLYADLNAEVIKNWTLGTVPTEPCYDGYKWDLSEVQYSAVSRWDLVCDRDWARALIMSCYFIGQFFGALFYGVVGDRFGRKVCFIAALLVQIVAGVTSAFVPHWPTYALLRFLLGTCHPGIVYIGTVVNLEMVGPQRRMLATVGGGVFWSLGEVVLGGLAYAIRNYQHLQLVISLPGLMFVGYWWLVPESVRWLVSQKRYDKANTALQVMARVNRTKLPENWEQSLVAEEEQETKNRSMFEVAQHFGSLFKSAIIRRHILVAWFTYFCVGMVYYGISVNPSFKGGDRYTTFMLSGAVAIPGVVMVPVFANYIGRKLSLIFSFTVSGVALMLTLAVPESSAVSVSVALIIVAKCTAGMAFNFCILFMAELFPTDVRNSVTGTCSAWARVGSVGCSWLVNFLTNQNTPALVLTFGSLALLAALSVFLVPETYGKELPETIAEAERLTNKQRFYTFKFNMKNDFPAKDETLKDHQNIATNLSKF